MLFSLFVSLSLFISIYNLQTQQIFCYLSERARGVILPHRSNFPCMWLYSVNMRDKFSLSRNTDFMRYHRVRRARTMTFGGVSWERKIAIPRGVAALSRRSVRFRFRSRASRACPTVTEMRWTLGWNIPTRNTRLQIIPRAFHWTVVTYRLLWYIIVKMILRRSSREHHSTILDCVVALCNVPFTAPPWQEHCVIRAEKYI